MKNQNVNQPTETEKQAFKLQLCSELSNMNIEIADLAKTTALPMQTVMALLLQRELISLNRQIEQLCIASANVKGKGKRPQQKHR